MYKTTKSMIPTSIIISLIGLFINFSCSDSSLTGSSKKTQSDQSLRKEANATGDSEGEGQSGSTETDLEASHSESGDERGNISPEELEKILSELQIGECAIIHAEWNNDDDDDDDDAEKHADDDNDGIQDEAEVNDGAPMAMKLHSGKDNDDEDADDEDDETELEIIGVFKGGLENYDPATDSVTINYIDLTSLHSAEELAESSGIISSENKSGEFSIDGQGLFEIEISPADIIIPTENQKLILKIGDNTCEVDLNFDVNGNPQF